MISIIGYYGENYGDLLMLRNLLEQLPDNEVTILTYGDAEKLSQQSFVKENGILTINLNGGISKAALHALYSSSMILWGGGTCFMDEGGTGAIKYMLLAKLMSFRKKIVYFGVGIDNHRKLKTKLILVAASLVADKIFCRDKKSIATFRKHSPLNRKKIQFAPDLAFSHLIEPTTATQDHVVFCSRDLTPYQSLAADTHSQLLAFADHLYQKLRINNVFIINADPSVDSPATEIAQSYFSSKGYSTKVISGSNLELTEQVIHSSHYLVTIRLHPAVTAALYNIPFSILNYSDKNRKFCEEIGANSLITDFQAEEHIKKPAIIDAALLQRLHEATRKAISSLTTNKT